VNFRFERGGPWSAPAQLGGDGTAAGGDPVFSPRGPSPAARLEPQQAAPAGQPPTTPGRRVAAQHAALGSPRSTSGVHFGALLERAGLDEGVPSLSLPNLLCMENPHSYKKFQW
jgi:hypothetical protein